ncbi:MULTISPECIES: HNH endonuclease [unclassified Sphingomonas]|uniref:HNH endonuclease n=1 Tax=unclassified Sphingomonas TaxID=196159 RepID=UPI0006F7B7D0|nr:MULTISPECIES: hypothetical protein [unclassified Sphingomonas]KQN11667.1 hypothetical protein ASE79_06260 [Sphingomonas sp. Leaf28]MBD8736819.1 hypothetical protein [Sphingomonas sp. CFBP 13706]
MRNLLALGNNPTYLSRYVAIRDSKQAPVRPVLVAHHAAISDRYQQLLDRAADDELEAIGNSPLLAIRSQLRACYDGKTLSLLALKKAIKDAQPQRRLKYCPYCGTTKSETHDHYLPATRFPEFAVNGLNLVPCCFRCNTIKDDDWLDGDGRRRFVHFYLDAIPDADFLKVALLVAPPLRGVGARFSIEQAGMDDDDWRLIRSHFDRLHLLERYGEDANDEIAEMLEAGAAYLQTGGMDVRAFLLLQAGNSADVFGRANWRAVLLRALAGHPDVEDWIAEFS